MNQIITDFFSSSLIPKNRDTINLMTFLTLPESVNKMIVISEIGMPALIGVVKELEERFANCKSFPLNHDDKGANATNRRNTGWCIKYIMKAYGYTPISKRSADTNSIERTRVGKFSKYFYTSTIYAKTIQNPQYTIEVKIL